MTTDLPGLVDLQVNGYAGHDLNGPDVDVETVGALTRALWRRGTTTYLGTVITAAEVDILRSLRAIAGARRADPLVRHSLVGVHMEGPFISRIPGARGAHDPDAIRPPDLAEFDRWQDAADGAIRMVTIAPEAGGTEEFIRGARTRGVLVSIGHSAASSDEIRAAVRAGAMLSTHLGNGAELTLPRHPNLLWAQLADDALTAMVILDGHHLPAETAASILRAKGLQRIILTSDSVALAGMPVGDHHTPVGGRVRVTEDGRLLLGDSGMLAGSGRALLECVDWAATALPFERDELLVCATANPAMLIGVSERVVADGDRLRINLHRGRSIVRSVRVAGVCVLDDA